jgi:hypothetical protein
MGTGFTVVHFKKDWVGFKDALAFHNYYNLHHFGKIDCNEVNRRAKYIFWLGGKK